MADRLNGKVALVTGSGSGIGRGICMRFAEEGAHICAMDLNRGNAEETSRRLGSLGIKVHVVEGDVSRREDCERSVRECVETLGRLDICCANAGIGGGAGGAGGVLDLSEESWARVIAVNQTGVFLTCQAAARQMVRQGQGGKLIITSSVASERGSRQSLAYPASKAAVRHMAKVMAVDLAEHRINVNAIGPGLVETPLTEAGIARRAELGQEATNNPWGRLGQPRDVANVALFLASDESEFVTGGIIFPDGGSVAGQIRERRYDLPDRPWLRQ